MRILFKNEGEMGVDIYPDLCDSPYLTTQYIYRVIFLLIKYLFPLQKATTQFLHLVSASSSKPKYIRSPYRFCDLVNCEINYVYLSSIPRYLI